MRDGLPREQLAILADLEGKSFRHKWRLADALAGRSPGWRRKEDTIGNKTHNKLIERKLDYIYRAFEVAR